jgi:hypothetical protein
MLGTGATRCREKMFRIRRLRDKMNIKRHNDNKE